MWRRGKGRLREKMHVRAQLGNEKNPQQQMQTLRPEGVFGPAKKWVPLSLGLSMG